MYELEEFLKKALQGFIDWFTWLFTKIAVYLLIGVIAIVFILIVVLIIKSLMTRDRYIEKGRAIERSERKD